LEDSVEVVLAQPEQVKARKGHKTDGKDSWWLAHLLRQIRPSFIPPRKDHGGKTTKGNRWLRGVLTECAWAASHRKEGYLREKFWRLARKNRKLAVVAVSHSILIQVYNVLSRGTRIRKSSIQPPRSASGNASSAITFAGLESTVCECAEPVRRPLARRA
jgi:hypothetical protein